MFLSRLIFYLILYLIDYLKSFAAPLKDIQRLFTNINFTATAFALFTYQGQELGDSLYPSQLKHRIIQCWVQNQVYFIEAGPGFLEEVV